jgi:hypothetical protein
MAYPSSNLIVEAILHLGRKRTEKIILKGFGIKI